MMCGLWCYFEKVGLKRDLTQEKLRITLKCVCWSNDKKKVYNNIAGEIYNICSLFQDSNLVGG